MRLGVGVYVLVDVGDAVLLAVGVIVDVGVGVLLMVGEAV